MAQPGQRPARRASSRATATTYPPSAAPRGPAPSASGPGSLRAVDRRAGRDLEARAGQERDRPDRQVGQQRQLAHVSRTPPTTPGSSAACRPLTVPDRRDDHARQGARPAPDRSVTPAIAGADRSRHRPREPVRPRACRAGGQPTACAGGQGDSHGRGLVRRPERPPPAPAGVPGEARADSHATTPKPTSPPGPRARSAWSPPDPRRPGAARVVVPQGCAAVRSSSRRAEPQANGQGEQPEAAVGSA